MLSKILQNETGDGKEVADIHFSTAMCFVESYIEERGLEVETPKDLVEAINHGEGMKGYICELYDIYHTCRQAKIWKKAGKAKEGECELTPLGNVNEVIYLTTTRNESHFSAQIYGYSHSKPLTWKFKKGTSTLVYGKRDRDVDVLEDDCKTEENLFGATYESDDDNEMPNIDQSSGSNILFYGAMIAVRLIQTGFMKRFCSEKC